MILNSIDVFLPSSPQPYRWERNRRTSQASPFLQGDEHNFNFIDTCPPTAHQVLPLERTRPREPQERLYVVAHTTCPSFLPIIHMGNPQVCGGCGSGKPGNEELVLLL